MRTVKLESLPDKGAKLKGQVDDLARTLEKMNIQIKSEQEAVSKMPGVVVKTVTQGNAQMRNNFIFVYHSI